MLSLGYPRVSFQHESPDANYRLLEAVKMHVTDEEIEEERSAANSPATTADNNQRAFQVKMLQYHCINLLFIMLLSQWHSD